VAYYSSIQKSLTASKYTYAALTTTITRALQAVLNPVLIDDGITDTFAKFIVRPGSTKIFLAELEPSEQKKTWTLHSGSIYYTTIDIITITAVKEDGTQLGEVPNLSDITAGKWYHGKDKLYMQASSGTPFAKVIVLNYKMYIATENITLNDIFYEGILSTVPYISQKKKEAYWGVSIISSGAVSIKNNKGSLDEKYKDYAWSNRGITILLGGDDLPYYEYEKQFYGIMTNVDLSTSKFNIAFVDKKSNFEDTIPKNFFTTAVYPNLDSEDVGKPIPLLLGTVFKVPTVCTSLALGSATSSHSFKILDTSVCTVNSISQVYVNDVAVTEQSADIAAASFKLVSGTYSPGDSVTVSIIADTANPIEQLKSIASNVLSIPYDSDNYNTDAIAEAVTDADIFPCGLAITKATSFLDICGDLMKSCMGSLYNNNEGKYTVKIWATSVEADLTNIDFTDIKEGSFKATSRVEDIRKTMRVGWRKNWGADSYAYVSLASDTTERVFGITKSKTVNTLQSSIAGANIMMGRLGLIFETETVRMKFINTGMQLASKNIGDQIQLSFKRQVADSNIEWINSLRVEINKISKDFINNKITVEVDDLKGVGAEVGSWTGDSPVFSTALGGGSMETWNPDWSAAQKQYALQNAGYWTDDDSFIDSSDSESFDKSKWW